jgi:two-component system cell cycle response regulator
LTRREAAPSMVGVVVLRPNTLTMSIPAAASGFSYTVALEGFSAFERTALASFFRLAAQRSPAYVQVTEAGMADFLIADADHPAALAAVKGSRRIGDTVFVGKSAPPGALAWLPRPIDPMHIVRELDSLVELRHAPPAPAADAAPAGTAGIAAMDLSRLDDQGVVDLLLPEADVAFQAAALAEAPTRAAAPAWRGGAAREVLVVEDSAIARKFLQLRLQRLGYRVQTSASGDDALDILEHHWFPIVFTDVGLGPAGSVDGFRVCQRIKQRAAQPGGAPTAVVLVTALTGSSDRVRGSLAGCDAYLTKPLMEAEFIAALKLVDPAFEWSSEGVLSPV